MVGMGKVDRHLQLLLQLGRPGELAAIVQRQAAAFGAGEFSDRLLELLGDGLGGAGLDLAGDQVAAGPIGTGNQVSAAAFTDHGIAFPMAQFGALVGFGRTLFDGAFAENLAPA